MSQPPRNDNGKRPADSSPEQSPTRTRGPAATQGAGPSTWSRSANREGGGNRNQPFSLTDWEPERDWGYYPQHVSDLLERRRVPPNLAPLTCPIEKALAATLATLDRERQLTRHLIKDVQQIIRRNEHLESQMTEIRNQNLDLTERLENLEHNHNHLSEGHHNVEGAVVELGDEVAALRVQMDGLVDAMAAVDLAANEDPQPAEEVAGNNDDADALSNVSGPMEP